MNSNNSEDQHENSSQATLSHESDTIENLGNSTIDQELPDQNLNPSSQALPQHPSIAELRARLNRIANSHSVPDMVEQSRVSPLQEISQTPSHAQQNVQTVGGSTNVHSSFWSLFLMFVMSAIFLGLLFRRITLSKADMQ